MKSNNFKGKLIAIDGPNGVGKSTIIRGVKEELDRKAIKSYITKEPSNTKLGDFARVFAEDSGGNELACIVAANRYEHLNNEIIPNLEEGVIVISDRYILSSLILQVMDDVNMDFILGLNQEVICPDLQIAIYADEHIIQKRLSERDSLTRFEKNNQTSSELKYLDEGVQILSKNGVKVVKVANNDNINDCIETIVNHIIQIWEKK